MRRTSSELHSIAVNRFGLGARPGERRSIRRDPRGWLLDQLKPGRDDSKRLSSRPGHPELFIENVRQRSTRDKQAIRQWGKSVYLAERTARFVHAATTAHPFRDRWVRFFSNHLCVSAKKRPIIYIVGAYEREAIRPHAVGRFSEMLLASTSHPAMLVYLDNQLSVGPDSAMGRSKNQGLNENLAREILELHTVGVDGGYTQADVIELAEMLTGWTMLRPRDAQASQETVFVFAGRRHQPGDKTLMGRTYPGTGEGEARQALQQLAVHPSTARHIAHKLAVHFVADDPPETIVDDLARCFLDTGGDLQAVGAQLIQDDRVWAEAARNPKLRTPEEVAIAMVRATGWRDDRAEIPEAIQQMERAIQGMGQVPLSPPSPAGWPDRQEAWSGPEQILRRVELAEKTGRRHRKQIRNPEAHAREILGNRLHPDTRRAISRAPDPETGLALLLASPEFQWR